MQLAVHLVLATTATNEKIRPASSQLFNCRWYGALVVVHLQWPNRGSGITIFDGSLAEHFHREFV